MQSTTYFGHPPWPLSSSHLVSSDSAPIGFLFPLVDASGSPLIGEIQSIGDCQLISDGSSTHGQRGPDFAAFQEHDSDAVISWDLSPELQHDLLLQSDVAPVAAAPKETAYGWGCEPSYWRHQTLMEFKDDILQNRALTASENASTFEEPEVQPFGYEEDAKDQDAASHGCDVSDSRSEGYKPNETGGAAKVMARKRVRETRHGTVKATYVNIATSSAKWPCRAENEHNSPRKKLTTEQKRRNHIRHEQTRRGRIRDGFKELTALVPKLQGETRSKSKILFTTTEWLQQLVARNEALEEQLRGLINATDSN
ncbi:hypothetical protein PWT90_08063 [Aphanocladium album]|nr:hypothetical protein PWT90_08063 [Aphanocladium album]